MVRTLCLVVAAAALLSGCGQHVATLTTAPVAAAPHVNTQNAVLDITAPAAKANAAIVLKLNFPTRKLMATVDDVDGLKVTLQTKTLLVFTKTLATANVTHDQIEAGKAAVQFTGLAAGTYSMVIEALDATGATIGSTTATSSVTEGQTSMVDAILHITGSAGATAAAEAS